MSQFKRKQFWVDSPLQVQMMGYVLVLVTGSLLLLSYSALHGLQEAAEAEPHKFFFSLDWVREAMRAPMIVAATLSIFASGLITLLWSHRFAGPLRVLSAAMGRLREGDLSMPVRIRKTDTHQDLVGEFAQMQDQLRARVERDRQRAHDAAHKLEGLLKHSSAKGLEGVVDELKKIGADYKL